MGGNLDTTYAITNLIDETVLFGCLLFQESIEDNCQ